MENWIIGAVVAGGVYHLAFGLFHLVFPFALRWKQTLAGLDATNRNLLPVFNLWIAYAILAWSAISLAQPEQVANSPVGHGVCWSIAGVWTFRHMMQVYYMGFSGSYALPGGFWGIRGIHALVFVPIFSLGTGLYLVPVLRDDAAAWLMTTGAIGALLFASWLAHRHRLASMAPTRADSGYAADQMVLGGMKGVR